MKSRFAVLLLPLALASAGPPVRGTENPVRLATLYADWSSGRAAVSGGYWFFPGGNSELHIMDVRAPAAPVRISGFNTGGYSSAVAVSGHYAFLADGDAGLQVIDVSNPAAPARAGGLRLLLRRPPFAERINDAQPRHVLQPALEAALRRIVLKLGIFFAIEITVSCTTSSASVFVSPDFSATA